jgi:microcompartment protein CcmL/EutN
MSREAVGTIEVAGLPAAIAASDVACKAADVTLLGIELTDGSGWVSVKVMGEVSAVKAAIDAASAAAAQVAAVVGRSLIARPDEQTDAMVLSGDTVGYRADPAANSTGDAASTLRMGLYVGPRPDPWNGEAAAPAPPVPRDVAKPVASKRASARASASVATNDKEA